VNAYLPELKATIDTCFKLGMGLLTIHLGLDRRAVDSFFVNRAVQVLRELVDYGSVRGVTVCLENVTEDAEDLGAVLDPVPGLGITLDVGHAQLGGDVNRSFEIIRRHGSCLRHVHLHDNNGGDHQDDLHLPIGEGVVDFSAILGALLASDYRGSMTLEVPVAGIRESKERLEGMLRRLG
jgi:sugar phosphate isomerase/epimerase